MSPLLTSYLAPIKLGAGSCQKVSQGIHCARELGVSRPAPLMGQMYPTLQVAL